MDVELKFDKVVSSKPDSAVEQFAVVNRLDIIKHR